MNLAMVDRRPNHYEIHEGVMSLSKPAMPNISPGGTTGFPLEGFGKHPFEKDLPYDHSC